MKPYPKYKPSGVEWLGEVPEGWEVKRLKYFASINDETLPETTSPDYEIEYVDIGGVDRIDGITESERILFDNAPSRARRKVKDGDTIVSTVRTYLRAIAPIRNPPENQIVSTGFAVVRPQTVNPDFLGYALKEMSFVESVVSRSTGVSYPAVNASEIGRIPISIPSKHEQHAIAAYLDRETGRIDTLLGKKRELIERLKEKRTALISRTVTRGLPADLPAKTLAQLETIAGEKLHLNPPLKPSGIDWIGEVPEGWVVKRLGFLVQKVGSGKTPRGGSQTYQSEGVMLIRSQNVYDDGLRLGDVVFIDDETDEGMEGSRVKTRDVLLNITGASLGRCAVVPSSFPKANVNQHVCIIRPVTRKLDSAFTQLSLTAQFVKDQIFAGEEGSSREGLNFQQVRNLAIPVPPLPEQRAIAAYLDIETEKLDALVAKVETAIERLREYRTALITAAVTGKIDVREGHTP